MEGMKAPEVVKRGKRELARGAHLLIARVIFHHSIDGYFGDPGSAKSKVAWAAIHRHLDAAKAKVEDL